MLVGPRDDETVISRKPSPSADGTNFDDFLVDDGLLVDGVDVNQLNVVIGGSVVVVVDVVVVVKGSSIKDERSSMLSESSSPNPGPDTNWLICSACLVSSCNVLSSWTVLVSLAISVCKSLILSADDWSSFDDNVGVGVITLIAVTTVEFRLSTVDTRSSIVFVKSFKT